MIASFCVHLWATIWFRGLLVGYCFLGKWLNIGQQLVLLISWSNSL